MIIESLIHVFRPKAVRHITKANRDSFLLMKQLRQGETSSRLADKEPETASSGHVALHEMATQTSPVTKPIRSPGAQ